MLDYMELTTFIFFPDCFAIFTVLPVPLGFPFQTAITTSLCSTIYLFLSFIQEFEYSSLTVYNSVDKSYYKQATEKLNNLFSEEKMAEFKEFEKKKDIPAHNLKIDEDEEETDPEILMLEKILAEKKAKRKQQQEEM